MHDTVNGYRVYTPIVPDGDKPKADTSNMLFVEYKDGVSVKAYRPDKKRNCFTENKEVLGKAEGDIVEAMILENGMTRTDKISKYEWDSEILPKTEEAMDKSFERMQPMEYHSNVGLFYDSLELKAAIMNDDVVSLGSDKVSDDKKDRTHFETYKKLSAEKLQAIKASKNR